MSENKHTIVLRFPIQVDGATREQLTMRRPKVRDMLAVEKSAHSNAEKEIQLFANLCEVPPETFHDLDMSDYTELQLTYQTFLSSRPAMPDALSLQ